MKPKYLEISAWGPYKNCESIDFDKMGGQGIFLISGSTGAGKTTIFDAICFALYGQVSGSIRGKDSLRSDFAASNQKTYVEMIFTHMGKEYKIRRNPKYERPKLKREGMTIEPEGAVLYMENGEIIDGIVKVNAKIEEILRIDYEQFKQISMIAQGEFQKLLNANSKERTEIFRNIFNTQIYERLRIILSKKASELKAQLETLNNKSEEAVHMAELDENEWQELISNESFNYEKIIIYMSKKINELKEKENICKDEILKSDKLYKKLINELSSEKQLREYFNQHKAAKEKLEEINAKAEEIKRLKEETELIKRAKQVLVYWMEYDIERKNNEEIKNNIEELRKELEGQEKEFEKISMLYEQRDKKLELQNELTKEINRLENEKKACLQLEELNMKYNKLMNEADELNKELTKEKENQTAIEKEIIEDNEKITQINDKKNNILEKKAMLAQTKSEYEIINDCIKKEIELNESQKALSIQKEKFIRAEKEAIRIQDEYLTKERQFRMAAAGILAKELKEDMPCPVCGSLSHPNKAKLTKEVLSEKEVMNIRKLWEKARKIADNENNILAGEKGKYEALYKELTLLQEKINIASDIQIKERRKALSENIEHMEDEISKSEKEIEALAALKQKILMLTQKLNETKEKYKETEEKYKNNSRNMQELKGHIMALNENISDGHKNLSEINDDITQKSVKLQSLKNQYNQILENYQDSSRTLSNTKTLLSQHEKEIKESTKSLKELHKSYAQACKEHGFKSEEDYQSVKYDDNKQIQAEKKINNYYAKLESARDNFARTQKLIKDKKMPDINALEEKIKHEEGYRKQKQKEKEKINNELSNIKKILQSIMDKQERIQKIEEEYGVVSELDKITRGDNPLRLMFEQYVLSAYFDEILKSANLRLKKMTEGRYELFRVKGITDARTKNGLDIEVMDNYTGKFRHVNTLSGGESFKASLALAFGTSDIMQNNAGGIMADTLFIDEGFGSLDRDSLEQAVGILVSMTGTQRMIGIISHVPELKEQITKQIVVEKTPYGSSIHQKN